MRKLLFLSLIACSCQVMGDTWSKGPNRVFVGPSYYYNRDTGISNPGLHSDENLWGATAGYEYYKPCNLFFRARALFDWGKAHGLAGNWVSQRQLGEGDVGYTFAFFKHWFATPYTGIQYVRDHIFSLGNPTTTDYTTYIPVGLLLGWDLNCEWNLKLRAQADIPFFHHVHFSYINVNTSLPRKTKWEFELPITYNPAPYCWDLSFVPFFNHTPHSSSTSLPFLDLGTFTYEASQVNTWGARLELGYDF